MQNTKIEYCDATWNPVTGCAHGCKYCYARTIANRFAADGTDRAHFGDKGTIPGLHVLDEKVQYKCRDGKFRPCAYPFGFEPTFLKYKLSELKSWRKPKVIFVCSMSDLFGEWVPDEWIEAVFAACLAAPQHTYLFLTKNPQRYIELGRAGKLPRQDNFWYGSSTPTPDDAFFYSNVYNTFASIEPVLADFTGRTRMVSEEPYLKWVIIGAETGSRKGRVVPKPEWIEDVVGMCREHGIPVFMKESMVPVVGEGQMLRELPWAGKGEE